MKKRLLAAFLIALLLSLCMGCGGSYGYDISDDSEGAMLPSADWPMEEMGEVGEDHSANSLTSGTAAPQAEGRKLIRSVELTLQTKTFEKSLGEILEQIGQSGGYIENQSIEGGGIDEQRDQYASIVARIPAQALDGTVSSIAQICHVSHQQSAVSDVTDQYFDTESRLKALRLQQDRLLELLTKAQTMEDIIQLEQRLSELIYEIEGLTGALRQVDSKVEYAYLTITLENVVDYSPVKELTFSDRLAAAWIRSGKNITRWFEGTLFFLIEDAPVLLLNLAILAIVVSLIIGVVGLINKKTGGKPFKQRMQDAQRPVQRPTSNSTPQSPPAQGGIQDAYGYTPKEEPKEPPKDG